MNNKILAQNFIEKWAALMHKNGIMVDPNTLMVSIGIPKEHETLGVQYNVIAAEISSREYLDQELLDQITDLGKQLILAVNEANQNKGS